jgi:FkbM family methyltransferase
MRIAGIDLHLGPLVAPFAKVVPARAVMPILQGPARGIRWQVGSGMMNFWLGTYEREKMAAFAAELRPETVVYDIGANVGAYTVLAASRCRQVHAFEPYSPNLTHLHRNVSVNRFKNCVIVPTAVGATDEPVSFEEGKDGFVGRVDGEGLLRVPCTRLDSYIGRHPAPDLVKMDIEGAEFDALQGARELLRTKRPTLFLATHGARVQRQCCALLEQNGYALEFLADDEIIARAGRSSAGSSIAPSADARKTLS